MTYIEDTTLRTPKGKVFFDPDAKLIRAVYSTASLHYADDNGVLQNVDMSPVRANNSTADGWVVRTSGWHYFVGTPKVGPFAGQDGVVGFGLNKGDRWFYSRLVSAGYLYAPSGKPLLAQNWTAVAPSAPNYARANLTRSAETTTIGTVSLVSRIITEWRRLWTTPNGGEVYIRWTSSGDVMKEDIVITALARQYIAANLPPQTPAADTYFGLAFRVDASAIPKWAVDGIEKQLSDFDDRDGVVELQDAAGAALAIMPTDYLIVGSGRSATRLKLRKRFWTDDDGNTYMVVGAPVSEIAKLPSGDLIFDPTINAVVGTGNDDGDMSGITAGSNQNVTSSGTMILTANLLRAGLHSTEDWTSGARFQNITVPPAQVLTSGTFGLAGSDNFTSGSVVDYLVACEDADNSAAFSTTAGDFRVSVRPRTTATATWDVKSQNLDTYKTIDITSAVQEVIDRAGWASGNALSVFCDTKSTSGDYQEWRSYNYSSSLAPKLDIIYPASSVSIPVIMHHLRQQGIN